MWSNYNYVYNKHDSMYWLVTLVWYLILIFKTAKYTKDITQTFIYRLHDRNMGQDRGTREQDRDVGEQDRGTHKERGNPSRRNTWEITFYFQQLRNR